MWKWGAIGLLVVCSCFVYWSALPSPSYDPVLPMLHYGMAQSDVEAKLRSTGVPFVKADNAVVAGKLTWLNLIREERQLVLSFQSGKLALVYEDRMRLYDDIGSKDVKIGKGGGDNGK